MPERRKKKRPKPEVPLGRWEAPTPWRAPEPWVPPTVDGGDGPGPDETGPSSVLSRP
jgi:hypothetical protein